MKQEDLIKSLKSLIEEMRCEKYQQHRNGLAKAAYKVVEDMENLTSDHKTSRGENNKEKLDDFRKEWLKSLKEVRGKEARFVVVDDLKEVKEKQVTNIEIATIYTNYWDSKPDSQGNVLAKHSIKKEHLEEMKKKGEILEYRIDDVGVKVTKRWKLKEDKKEGTLKSKRIEL